MSYIGKIPATGNFVKLDAISVVNGQASYTMQSNSVNFTPESANHMLVSLNGVIQAPVSSFTVSGSTITFASALSTGDVINFIMVYGNVLDIGTPSDNTVSTAKLVDTSVTAGKLATDSVQTAKIVDDAVTKAKVNFISDSTAGVEVKGDGGSNDGYIQLNCSQNSHGVKIKSPPHSAGQSYTLTLPQSITNDYYLKTDGSGNLSFAQVSSDVVKIASSTLSSNTASVSLTGMDSTYKNFKILASDVTLSSSENLYFRFIESSGDITASSYYGVGAGGYATTSSDAALRYSNSSAAYGRVCNFDFSTNATNSSAFEMYIPNPSNSATYPLAYGNVGGSGSNGTYMMTNTFAFQFTSAKVVTGIKFYTPSGNGIDTGSFQLYGLKA